ncbi:hypothetical protein LXT21_13665 [Myxococcus sp. K38C18041901]|uniref:hypothetical protein n=1 Tax=Myxococcus guangdongensis TaxID=2906760 RepID=UPI0020A797E6|nr:hypothetical protein [Myxococcus guangdongensis]MCP3059827.1 hypothetical protein [Myxococcus guangdongensis]
MDPSNNIDPTLDFDWKAEVLETCGHDPSWAYEETAYRVARLQMLLRHLESRHPNRP